MLAAPVLPQPPSSAFVEPAGENVTSTPFERGYVVLKGTSMRPELEVYVDGRLPSPFRRLTYLDWLKSLPGKRWSPSTKLWTITGLGVEKFPDRYLSDAGLGVRRRDGSPVDKALLDTLIWPVAEFSPGGQMIYVHHRLSGFDHTRELLGFRATWNKAEARFEMPVAEVLDGSGKLRPGVAWPEGAAERALAIRNRVMVRPEYVDFVESLSKGVHLSPEDEVALADWLKLIPEWFGVDLYGYQKLGALSVAMGHSLLADSPGVGKTFQALAAASVRRSKRTLIVCPPLVMLNWKRSSAIAGIAEQGGDLDGDIIAMVGTAKKNQHPPESGVFIVADSKLAAKSRGDLREELREWNAEVMIYDEAHRAMTMGTARSDAALDISRYSDFCIPVTGTPILASPHQLVPLLEMSGHIGPVFGGSDAFLRTYCTQDRFGNFRPKRAEAKRLRERLDRFVWTRRIKTEVLPDLPTKSRQTLPVQVPLTEYKQAHAEVNEAIDEWIDTHVIPAVIGIDDQYRRRAAADKIAADYCQTNLGHVSRLRQAAGACKVPSAIEFIEEHDFSAGADGGVDRPLIIWAYHRETNELLAEAARKKLDGTAQVALLDGSTPAGQKDAIVDDFQAGKIGVLVAGITAAGVGITLTRSQDMLFVESDWTPAIVVQAEDRSNRIGSLFNLQITTLVAEGTLDGAIQSVLFSKGELLDAVTGGDVQVANESSAGVSVGDILAEIVQNRIDANPHLKRPSRAQ